MIILDIGHWIRAGRGAPIVKEGDWEIGIPVYIGMALLVIGIYFLMRYLKKKK